MTDRTALACRVACRGTALGGAVLRVAVLRNAALRSALLLSFAATLAAAATVPTFQVDGRTYGMPEAQIFEDPYTGPPVVGEYVTLLPNLAPLPPGNRTHKVRFDIIAREIEVAPDVRYRAWTFGGTVPGPVLHVREGDRVDFTMKNRSAEVVAITAPEVAGSPYLQQLATLNPQKAVPLAQPMRHSMDFHAGTVAASDKWRGIEPGRADRAHRAVPSRNIVNQPLNGVRRERYIRRKLACRTSHNAGRLMIDRHLGAQRRRRKK